MKLTNKQNEDYENENLESKEQRNKKKQAD